jgi:hypothetical protein
MIMSRTAENHGSIPYRISQEVVFNHFTEPLTVIETWTIINEREMRLDVVGKGLLKDKIRLNYIYDDNRRYYLDTNMRRQSVPASMENFETYFHFRSSKNIKPWLVSLKIAPSESLKSGPPKGGDKNLAPKEEPFVRLARSGGTISYFIGTPSASDAQNPGLWIEQDQFIISKLRLRPNLEIIAQNYKNYPRGLKLPSIREIKWDDKVIRVLTTNVAPLTSGPNLKKHVSPRALIASEKEDVFEPLLPEDQVLRDFYTKLR